MVTGVGSGDSASDPLVGEGAGVDLPPPLGGEVFGDDVFEGEPLTGAVFEGADLVGLGALPLDVGELGLGVLVVVVEVVDGSGVPVVVVPSVVVDVAGVGAVLVVGDPVPDGVPEVCVVVGPLAVGMMVVGTVTGAPGAVARTVTQ